MDHLFLKIKYTAWNIEAPDYHVVLGSGLANSFDDIALPAHWRHVEDISFSQVPGGPASTAPGHKGIFRYFQNKTNSRVVCFQIGRLHGYEGLGAWQAIQPVVASARAGTKNFILTNAAGGLKKDWQPGSVMMIDDHVNLTGQNPLYGPNHKDETGQPLGPRFPDMTHVWNARINQRLEEALRTQEVQTHHGVYLGLGGPSYETPAEIRLFQQWGLGAVGMSTVWEAIALRYLGKNVAGFSLISNFAAGITGNTLSHQEVEEIAKRESTKIIKSLFIFLEKEIVNA